MCHPPRACRFGRHVGIFIQYSARIVRNVIYPPAGPPPRVMQHLHHYIMADYAAVQKSRINDDGLLRVTHIAESGRDWFRIRIGSSDAIAQQRSLLLLWEED